MTELLNNASSRNQLATRNPHRASRIAHPSFSHESPHLRRLRPGRRATSPGSCSNAGTRSSAPRATRRSPRFAASCAWASATACAWRRRPSTISAACSNSSRACSRTKSTTSPGRPAWACPLNSPSRRWRASPSARSTSWRRCVSWTGRSSSTTRRRASASARAVDAARRRGNALPAAQPLRGGQGDGVLGGGQLPRGLRAVRVFGHPVQPRVAVAPGAVRDAEDRRRGLPHRRRRAARAS